MTRAVKKGTGIASYRVRVFSYERLESAGVIG